MIRVWAVSKSNAKADVEFILDDLKIFGSERIEFFSKRRNAWIVGKRRDVAKEMRKLGYSFPEIGWAMGKHHTTILNLVRNTGWNADSRRI